MSTPTFSSDAGAECLRLERNYAMIMAVGEAADRLPEHRREAFRARFRAIHRQAVVDGVDLTPGYVAGMIAMSQDGIAAGVKRGAYNGIMSVVRLIFR